MVNSEKLCLQWNEFPNIVGSAFEELKDDRDLTDVTLVCKDGKEVEAHKVVLASTSPFFLELFKRNKHPHPLVFMKGVKGDDLLAMVEFLYSGEANVGQENLDTFLALAEELKLKGLNGNEGEGENTNKIPPPPKRVKTVANQMVPLNHTENEEINVVDRNQIISNNRERALDLNGSSSLEDLDNQIRAMMEKSENNAVNSQGKDASQGKGRICKVCGKEGQMNTIQRHIEANHITGFTHECKVCGITVNTRHALTLHMLRKHEKL